MEIRLKTRYRLREWGIYIYSVVIYVASGCIATPSHPGPPCQPCPDRRPPNLASCCRRHTRRRKAVPWRCRCWLRCRAESCSRKNSYYTRQGARASAWSIRRSCSGLKRCTACPSESKPRSSHAGGAGAGCGTWCRGRCSCEQWPLHPTINTTTASTAPCPTRRARLV